ncbi:hypothetical protein [Arthrobacter sp. ERGS1:01]|uniref:hypothetical protein n=1 Tax=Arthrobacter sp. ERGS1:01 TaxID=1704044 RepID=UPI000A4EFC47|nr:hypothetical protein [Arthrobacter sp. ERGS1:01]
MPLWLLIAIIVVAWLLAVAIIVMFMMGAARGRNRARQDKLRHLQAARAEDADREA